jgi:hypothetical protein
MDRVYTIDRLLGGHLLAVWRAAMNDRTKKSVTLSMRVTPDEAEAIRIAATAHHLDVGPYLYSRVTNQPILSTPALAALAELISTLHRLEAAGMADAALMQDLRREIVRLSRWSADHGKIV